MKKFIGSMGGRKFVVAVVTVLIIAINRKIGLDLDPAQIGGMAATALGFAVAQGYADGKSDGKTSTTTD